MLNTDLDIRRYEPGDAEAVLSVREDSLLSHGWEFEDTSPAPQEVTDEYLGISTGVLDAGGEFLVGLEGDEIVAIGGFKPRDEGTAELVWMGVHSSHQRTGYGARMLEALEERAVSNGFTRIVLDTFERLVIAQRLYEKSGYREIGRESNDRTGEDRIRYSKELEGNTG